jgi:hypothetical protein
MSDKLKAELELEIIVPEKETKKEVENKDYVKYIQSLSDKCDLILSLIKKKKF